MSFKRRIPWTSQPQYPVEIDWSNPFGIVSAFTPINQSGLTAIAGPTDIVSPLGREKYFGADNSSLYRTATAREKSTSASILWLGEFKGTATVAGTLGGTTYDAANTAPYVGIAIKRKTTAAPDDIFLTSNNTTTFNNVVSAGTSYTTGLYLIIGTVTSGAQVLYVKNIATGAVEKVSATVSGNMAYTATSRFEVGDSLNARNPQAACALQALAGRAWTEVEVKNLLDNPWQIFPPIQRRIFVDAAAGGQTLSPTLYTDADTFYAHAVTAGAVTLSPTLFTDADTFYSASLSASIGLSPTLFTDADTFYAHAITAGAVTLSPTLYDDPDTFYAATLSQASPQTLTASLFTDLDTFYGATIPSDALSGGGGAGYFEYLPPRKPHKRPRSVKEILDAAMATLDEAPAPVQAAARKAVAPFIAKTPVFTFESAVDVNALALDVKRVDILLKLLVEYERVQEEEEEEMLLMWTVH